MVRERRTICGLVDGRVQGVGFRWFVLQAARRCGVTGDVRNLSDGRVEFRAQGASADVERLLCAVREGPLGARVSDVVTREVESGPSFERFEIRH